MRPSPCIDAQFSMCEKSRRHLSGRGAWARGRAQQDTHHSSNTAAGNRLLPSPAGAAESRKPEVAPRRGRQGPCMHRARRAGSQLAGGAPALPKAAHDGAHARAKTKHPTRMPRILRVALLPHRRNGYRIPCNGPHTLEFPFIYSGIPYQNFLWFSSSGFNSTGFRFKRFLRLSAAPWRVWRVLCTHVQPRAPSLRS